MDQGTPWVQLTKTNRGIAMGSKADFEAMNSFIEQKNIHFDSLLVQRPFSFANARDAYDRLESGKFHGKIVIKIPE